MSLNKTKIELKYAYIAGFFDGEGSAMVLTIKRKTEENFRFRPVIKISQKTVNILKQIKDTLGFGTVIICKNQVHCYQVNGSKNILKFIDLVSPYIELKKEQLLLLKSLILLQNKNRPYTKEELIRMIEIRDKVHLLNQKTRSNIKLKYNKAEILDKFIDIDIVEWNKKRSEKGIRAMINYQKNRKMPRKLIYCKCGCGIQLSDLDKKARKREYILGHNQKN